MKKTLLVAVCVLIFAGAASPQERDARFGVDFFVGTPSASRDIFQAVFPGASLRFRYSGTIEFSLDYAFMGFEYYYPESPSGPWSGPVAWSSMPSRFGGMQSDWIFFQTRHFIAPQIWYIASLQRYGQPLAIRVGAGPAFSAVFPGEAAEFYPGLLDAEERFLEAFDIHPGWSFRLGLEYRPRRMFRAGAEYLFVIDSVAGFASEVRAWGWDYFNQAGNFLLFAGLRI